MKLTNPTDGELNAAFAEGVAGWTRTNDGFWRSPDMAVGDDPKLFVDVQFIASFDAVLPWLLKTAWFNVSRSKERGAHCEIDACHDASSRCFLAESESVPRACVIALLRAHGVEIEFTK